MDNVLAVRHEMDDTLLSLVANGDAAKLTADQKLQYFKARCDAAGLDYRAQPFQFISMNGKLVLYALKAATDQLASKHGIKLEIQSQATENGLRTVVVRAIAQDGRQTDEIGVVPVDGIKGADLANAFMKAVTKAKRRAVLSLCGLGMMDESELDTVIHDSPKASVTSSPATVPEIEEMPNDGVGPEIVDTVDQTLFPPRAEPPVAKSGTKISEAQGRRLYAIWKSAKKDDVAVNDWLFQKYGYQSSREILRSDYEAICEGVKNI